MINWLWGIFETTVYGTSISVGVLSIAVVFVIVLFSASIWLNNWLITLFKKLISRIPGEEKSRISDRVTGFAPSLYLLIIILGVTSVVSMQSADYHWLVDNLAFRLAGFGALVSLVLALARFTPVLISIYLHNQDRINKKSDRAVDPTLRSLFVIIFNIILFVVAAFQAFEILGIKPTSLVAGASVTAIILGFALQNVLGDIFSSFSLYLDQPFRVGDTIKVGTETGRVLSIGFKTTRLKTLHGEELIISNSELTKTQIKNLERLRKRRVDLVILIQKKGITSATKSLPTLAKKVITEYEELQFEQCTLTQINEKSYQYLCAYNVLTPSYQRHHELKELVLVALIATCQKSELEIVSAQ
jgi:small-conductance mechanosensitive channel